MSSDTVLAIVYLSIPVWLLFTLCCVKFYHDSHTSTNLNRLLELLVLVGTVLTNKNKPKQQCCSSFVLPHYDNYFDNNDTDSELNSESNTDSDMDTDNTNSNSDSDSDTNIDSCSCSECCEADYENDENEYNNDNIENEHNDLDFHENQTDRDSNIDTNEHQPNDTDSVTDR